MQTWKVSNYFSLILFSGSSVDIGYSTFNPLSANAEYTPHYVMPLVAIVAPRTGKIIKNGCIEEKIC